MSTTFNLPGNQFITVTPSGVESNLKTGLPDDVEADAAVDGLEALLLAMAGQGIPLDTPAMHRAVESAAEAIANNS